MVGEIKKGYLYKNKKLVIHKKLSSTCIIYYFIFFQNIVKNNLFINIILVLFTVLTNRKTLNINEFRKFSKILSTY